MWVPGAIPVGYANDPTEGTDDPNVRYCVAVLSSGCVNRVLNRSQEIDGNND